MAGTSMPSRHDIIDTRMISRSPRYSPKVERRLMSPRMRRARSNSFPNILAPMLDEDMDILTDRKGVHCDLRYQDVKQIVQDALEHYKGNMTSLTERMCGESLEDCHAFSDVHKDGEIPSVHSSSSANPAVPAFGPLFESDDEEDVQQAVVDGSEPPLRMHATQGVIELLRPAATKQLRRIRSNSLPTDLLTDKRGMKDLEYSDSHEIVQDALSPECRCSMQSVPERMCDDSLDDCHAFTHLSPSRSGLKDKLALNHHSWYLEPLAESEETRMNDAFSPAEKEVVEGTNIFMIGH